MSIILGTNGSNTLTGTAGSDLILAGNGNDTVDGGNGSDLIDGGNGNDTLTGGAGNDAIAGDNGNDTIDGGAGNDLVLGGNGNDLVIHRASENGGLDAYDGGNGQDTLRLIVSQALANSAAFQAEVAQFQWQINHYGSASGYFNTLDLWATSFEQIQIVIDQTNQPPIAVDDSASASEDIAVTIAAATLLGNDSDPDAGDTLALVSVQDAVNGSVAINGSGDVVFTPAANYSGPASFTYTIQDAAGATSTATVVVAVAAVADTPTLSVANTTGTENPAIALNIAATLTDTDGSETLTVEISGIPAGGTLNHGSENGGVWTVAGADLATLELTPPTGFSGPLNLSVVARSTETSNASTAVSAAQTLTVVVPIIGTNGDDTALTGTANDDLIFGLDGNDIIDPQGGNDTVHGGDGDDLIGGSAGSDTLDGGAGFDTVRYGLALGPITADLAAGTVVAGPDTDTLISIEGVLGSTFNDTLRGNAGNNTLNGNDGNDFLVGRLGNDTLIGGNGIDIARFSGVIAGYAFGAGTVTGADGADTTNGVELLQFDDAYRLGFGNSPINLTGFGLIAGQALFGRDGAADQLTMGVNANGRLIDLGGGPTDIDSLTLGTANASYSLNLANVEQLNGSFGDEIVTLAAPVTNNMLVDLSFGANDVLNTSGGNDILTVSNVETLFNAGGTDTITFLHNDFSVNQTFNFGTGTGCTLTLDGSDANYSFTLFGNMTTVVGNSDSGNENVNILNNQGGTTFDLGAGNDTLTLNSSAFPNSVTVANVEQVTAIGFFSDTIVIAGNSGGFTTVTAGGGGDMITASADEDHFRFTSAGDSLYDLPGAGQHDIITGFDAAADVFVFDGIPAPAFSWGTTSFAGNDFVRVDFDGDAVGETGWDMVFQVNGLTGTLTNANFLLI